jgi:hypothetical protein
MVTASAAPVWFHPVGIPLVSRSSNPGFDRVMGLGAGAETSVGGISVAEGSLSGVVTIGLGSKVGLVRGEPGSVPVSWGLISGVAAGGFVVHPTTTLMTARSTTSSIHDRRLFRYIVYRPLGL